MLFISKTLPYSFCTCVLNTPRIGKNEIGVFQFVFLDAFTPRPKMPFTYAVNVYSDMSLLQGYLGSRGGGASKNKHTCLSIASSNNVTFPLVSWVRCGT